MSEAIQERVSDIEALMTTARALRDEKDQLNKQLKQVNGELKEVDYRILSYLEDQNLDKISMAGNTAIRAEKKVANVGDWDALFNYIADNRAFHLLQRRVSNNVAVEALELGETLPSVELQTFNDLGFRRG